MSSCEVDLDELPTKYVRVTVHVFQKDDGSENIPDDSEGNTWIANMINSVNADMGGLSEMNLSTSSPYFEDSKIRYDLVNTYFWQNTTMWAKGNNTSTNGTALYNYIQGQTISHKSTSIHILIPGNYENLPNDGLRAAGIASGIGDKKWNLLEDVYHYYVEENTWEIPNTLQHELGHNLDLHHTWNQNDACDDTPTHSNCWNGDTCSNNMIDENACTCPLTLCQATRMHVWLHETNDGQDIMSAGFYDPPITGTIESPGYSGPLGCCTINIYASSATITLTDPETSFEWTKLGGTGSFYTEDDGATLHLSGVETAYINMKVTFTLNCVGHSQTYTFYDGGSFYSVWPNPASDEVNIEVKNENELELLVAGITGKKTDTYMETVTLYRNTGEIVWTENPPKKSKYVKINASRLEPGTYYVAIKNGGFLVQKKVLKI